MAKFSNQADTCTATLPKEYLCTDPVPAAEIAGHEAVRAGVGVVLLHVTERNKLPAPVSAQSVRAGTFQLLVIVNVFGLYTHSKHIEAMKEVRCVAFLR